MEVKVGDGIDNGFTIVGDNADKLSKSKKFWRWFDNICRPIKIRRVEEKGSFWFRGELAFALFLVEYLDEEKREKSSVIFYRSDAVAVFLVLKDRDTKKRYVALVEQLRVPAGQKLLEIPAGIVESEEDDQKTAVREIKEEVDIEIAQKDLRFMGRYFFSPGACPEKVALYSCQLTFSHQEIELLEGRLTGLKEEGENIRVRLLPLEIFGGLVVRDAKTQLAYELYLEQEKRDNEDRNFRR